MACVHLAAGYGLLGPSQDLPTLALAATVAPAIGVLVGSLASSCTRSWLARIALLVAAGAGLVFLSEGLGWSGMTGSWAHPRAVGLFGLFWLGASVAPTGGRLTAGCEPAAQGWPVTISRAAFVVLFAWILDGAASAWGLVSNGPPWSPEVAAELLNLSPRAFVMEIAGADWMRFATVYEPVGTDRISPDLRPGYAPGSATGWGRVVAVLPVVVVGSGLMGLRWKRASPPRATPGAGSIPS
ncbi:MAG: hypothetical protein AAGG01_10030 [Planctomycetota bacterium]